MKRKRKITAVAPEDPIIQIASISWAQFYEARSLLYKIEENSPVSIFWNAGSTLVESRADVSIKLRPFFSANALASSIGMDLEIDCDTSLKVFMGNMRFLQECRIAQM